MAVWGVGVALMLVYGGGSIVVLRRKLKGAHSIDCGYEGRSRIAVYEKKNLPTPFVLGIIRPKIYLPTDLSESEKQYILLHEQIHIRRGDHIVKAVSFLVLCIHWFNPMVWAAFFLSERDMEMSCDEAVLRKLGSEVKKDYSAALLNLATGRRIIGGMPLAFGEGTPGSRIRNVLKYKQPQLTAVCAGIVLAATAAVLLLANPQSGESGDGEDSSREQELSQGQEDENVSAETDITKTDTPDNNAETDNTKTDIPDSSAGAENVQEPGVETSGMGDPEEKNRELRAMAMERDEAFTWEILQKLIEEPLPLLEDYAGYEGAVWDDMGGDALNRYLSYILRDEKNGQNYRLLVSYMAEDNRVNMMYLQRESDISELGLYLEETGWRNADIEEFLEHIPSLADWIAEYQLPQEEKLQADAFSALIGYGGGQTFQWIWKDRYTMEPGDSCPEEWKAAAVIFRLDGERLVFDTAGSGILKDVLSRSNHSGFVTEPVPVEGCEEQAILVQFSCDLFTAAELAEAEEAGIVIPEEDTAGRFWYVCFGREGALYGYVAGLNMRYFSEEDAVEFAKSIRFTESAWQ